MTGRTSTPASTGVVSAAGAGQASGGLARFRPSSSAVLLSGLLVILIALGVGVLIGHDNNVKPNRPANVTVNEIGGGASSGTAAASTGSAANSVKSTSPSTGATRKSTSAAKKTVTKAAVKAASATNPNAAAKGKAGTAAAAKTFSNTATKKSTLGGSCSPGTTGCSSSGKQTGNLF